MDKRIDDLTGRKFGHLTVLRYAGQAKDHHAQWLCQCDCGSEPIIVVSNNLKRKHTTSCGCVRDQVLREFAPKNGTHYKRHTRLYSIWADIKQRCENQNHPRFKDYGGRNVLMCDEWKNNFEAFYEWAVLNGYQENLSIDRKNNDGNYEPSNCRWVTDVEQANNKRNNHYLSYNGEVHTMAEWSRITGISYGIFNYRVNKCSWSVEKIIQRYNKNIKGGK